MTDHEQIFDADLYLSHGKRGQLPKELTPKRESVAAPTVKIGGKWQVIRRRKSAPLAHYVTAPPGTPIMDKGRMIGRTQSSTLLCGMVGSVLDVDVGRFDACEKCVKKHRDGHHLWK